MDNINVYQILMNLLNDKTDTCLQTDMACTELKLQLYSF